MMQSNLTCCTVNYFCAWEGQSMGKEFEAIVALPGRVEKIAIC